MVQAVTSYKTADGRTFDDPDEADKHEARLNDLGPITDFIEKVGTKGAFKTFATNILGHWEHFKRTGEIPVSEASKGDAPPVITIPGTDTPAPGNAEDPFAAAPQDPPDGPIDASPGDDAPAADEAVAKRSSKKKAA